MCDLYMQAELVIGPYKTKITLSGKHHVETKITITGTRVTQLLSNEVRNMPAKVITVAIEKGGTGKTVTASNLAYLMGEDGKKVLCIDTDPQGNLTSALSDEKVKSQRVCMKGTHSMICSAASGIRKPAISLSRPSMVIMWI